jgi:hypothetical protein
MVRSACKQCNSLRATAHTPDGCPSQTEICRVVVEGYEVRVIKPGAALNTVVVYIYFSPFGSTAQFKPWPTPLNFPFRFSY